LVTGNPIQTFTLSPEGGCVTVAVTRHQPFEGSIVADSIVVFGIDTFARLSHEHTGAALEKIGFGALSAARAKLIATKSAAAMNIGPLNPRHSHFVSLSERLMRRIVSSCAEPSIHPVGE